MPPIIATLSTNQSYQDLKIFLTSLSLHYTPANAPTVYLFCDAEIMAKVLADNYNIFIVFNECLDDYSGKTRAEMELQRRPNGKTLWYEFQMEKLNLLDWVFTADPDTATTEGVFYLDSDLCFFAPLPKIPDHVKVAVSPHMIRQRDEARFGKYNGGCLWVCTQRAINAWREACPASRFHEQAALECFDEPEWSNIIYHFPAQVNYGWWRMWQGSTHPSELQAKWAVTETAVTIDSQPLQTVHTHFYNPSDMATKTFNNFVINKLAAISTPQAAALLQLIKIE